VYSEEDNAPILEAGKIKIEDKTRCAA